MGYLQPWMWWALPAVLLPILIHLLNRLRYKTVHWAAMVFLLKANRAATRRAKIRQYLLLACRTLVIFFLIWAMSRPLVGGWIGAAAGGAPETVLILLDRSASMEAHGGQPETKRAHGLGLLSAAAKQSGGSHFVLFENALRQPLEIAEASGLGALQLTEATDTATDVPAMFRAALDYLQKNKPGSAEVWVASDLQASNWRPESAEWADIAARFAGLPQSLHVRVLDLSAPPSKNVSIAVKSADLRVLDEKTGRSQLSLNLELRSDGEQKDTQPIFVTRDGARSQTEVALKSATQRINLKYDLPKAEPGWGKVELPADDNLADNTAYFAYTLPPTWRALVVGNGQAANRLRFAAAPDQTRGDRSATVVEPAAFSSADLKTLSLVMWAASTEPDATVSAALEAWVKSGGVLLCFPPSGEGAGPLGLSWAAPETAPERAPFRVTAWDDLDGPLSRTENGSPLPLARLEMPRRQVPSMAQPGHAYAAYPDGRPFLLGRKVGAGHVFAFAAQPDPTWGNLGEGLVLLPAVQRLLALGGQRLAPPAMALAGEWKPANPNDAWASIETDRRRDWRWHAGVYASGADRVALNRPESEDAPELVDRTRLPELLHGVKVSIMSGALELKADRLQSEIWPAMIMVTMLFMCVEMLLATSKSMLPTRVGGGNTLRRATS